MSLVHNESGRVRGPLGAGRLRSREPVRLDPRARPRWTCRCATARAGSWSPTTGVLAELAARGTSRPRATCRATAARARAAYPDNPNGSTDGIAGIYGPHGQDLRPDAAPRGVPLPGKPPRVDARAVGTPPRTATGSRSSRTACRRAIAARDAARCLTCPGPFPMMNTVRGRSVPAGTGGVAQLARALEWHSRGRGFNSRRLQ